MAGNWTELARQAVLRPFREMGTIGVPVFFLISGYIITTLLLRDVKLRGEVSIAAFYIRRLFRIFPALSIYLLAIATADALGFLDVSLVSLLASASFTCNIYQCDWWYAHLWSLAVEEQFYLAWPLMFVVFYRQRLGLLLALAIVFFVMSAFWAAAQPFLYITLGALVAVDASRRGGVFVPPVISWISHAILIAQAFTTGPAVLVFFEEWTRPLVVAGLFFGSFNSPTLKGVIVWRPLAAVGTVSYGLYLWQQLFTATSDSYRIPFSDGWLLALPLLVIASYYFIERPAILFGR